MPPVIASWEQKFLELLPLILKTVEFVARRYRLSKDDADDFASEIQIKLIENDYARLRQFEGRSSMRTFLTTVISRALQDFLHRERGKWRPSVAAMRAGRDAVLLEQLLVRDQRSFEEAVHIMTTHHGVTDRSELERIASQLPVRFRRRFESDEALASVPTADRADACVLRREWTESWERVVAALRIAQDKLPSQDALILAMRFEDGMKISQIAETLKIESRPLYARVYRLFDDIRGALEEQGIDATLVRRIFEDKD